MKIDIHIMTCHRCDYVPTAPGFNPNVWKTPEERLEISKISIDSFRRFISSVNQNSISSVSIINDGSTYEPALKWLSSITDIDVVNYDNMGSGPAMSKYIESLDDDVDLVAHFEDDQIMFNPLNKDWADIAYRLISSEKEYGGFIRAVCFRSGHGCISSSHHKYAHSFTKKYNLAYNTVPYLGNSQFVIDLDSIKQLLPIEGNRGNSETYINEKKNKLGIIHAEIQDHIFMFHSHVLEGGIPQIPNTDSLRNWVKGEVFGIKNLHQHLLGGNMIDCIIVTDEINGTYKKETLRLEEYYYGNKKTKS